MPREGTVARGRYRMKDHGARGTRRGLQGVYVLQENSGCQIWRPTWHHTHTVFRPFPGRNPENPNELDKFRLSEDPRDVGDWIRSYDAACSLGYPGSTFIVRDGRDDDESAMQNNPVVMLHRNLTAVVKSGQGDPRWNPLIFGAEGRGAPVEPPKTIYLMQGILMEHKSKPCENPIGLGPDQQTCVLMASSSVGDQLMDELLMLKNEDGTWVYEDLADLAIGAYFDIHQSGTHGQTAAASSAPLIGQGGSAPGRGQMQTQRYEVVIMDSYNGIPPRLDQVSDQILPKIRAWDDIVRLPDIEEQVRMICNAGLPASAIMYALGDYYRDAIPQHVVDRAQAEQSQTTVASTGMPFSQGQDQPAGGNNGPQLIGGGSPPSAVPGPTAAEAPNPAPVTSGGAMLLGTGAPAPDAQGAISMPPGGPPEAGPTPSQEGFDPEPTTHAEEDRALQTVTALEAARARSRQAQQS